jgi:hypothetical protein
MLPEERLFGKAWPVAYDCEMTPTVKYETVLSIIIHFFKNLDECPSMYYHVWWWSNLTEQMFKYYSDLHPGTILINTFGNFFSQFCDSVFTPTRGGKLERLGEDSSHLTLPAGLFSLSFLVAPQIGEVLWLFIRKMAEHYVDGRRRDG